MIQPRSDVLHCSSAYAEQLAKGPSARFSTDLEAEYQCAHLARIRTRARVWFTFNATVCLISTVANTYRFGVMNPTSLLHLLILFPGFSTILFICWSSTYQTAYLRFVPYIYSVLLCIISGSVAAEISRGELDAVGQLICNIFAVYFFANFSWRHSVLLSSIAAASLFLLCCIAFVDLPIILRCEGHVLVASVAAAVVSFDIERTNRKRFLQESLLNQMATHDSLSGLMNRRSFDEHLARLWSQGLRDRRPIVLLLLDVDHFKRFNDSYGHQAGDSEIRRVASVIQEFGLRPMDLAARYGGEEFAVLLYDLSVERAFDLAEQLRKRIKNADQHDENMPYSTVSIGVAVGTPTIGRTPAGLLQLADEALYLAKRDGRDRCVLSGQKEHEQLTTGAFERNLPRARVLKG